MLGLAWLGLAWLGKIGHFFIISLILWDFIMTYALARMCFMTGSALQYMVRAGKMTANDRCSPVN